MVHVNAQPYLDERNGDGPIVVVLAPTRELVAQIAAVFQTYAASSKITTVAVYGGAPRAPQQKLLRQKTCAVIAATPGRLLDSSSSAGDVSLAMRVTFLVVDEVDRMLDLGFEPQIRKISEEIRPDRQTLMTARGRRRRGGGGVALCADAASLPRFTSGAQSSDKKAPTRFRARSTRAPPDWCETRLGAGQRTR